MHCARRLHDLVMLSSSDLKKNVAPEKESAMQVSSIGPQGRVAPKNTYVHGISNIWMQKQQKTNQALNPKISEKPQDASPRLGKS